MTTDHDSKPEFTQAQAQAMYEWIQGFVRYATFEDTPRLATDLQMAKFAREARMKAALFLANMKTAPADVAPASGNAAQPVTLCAIRLPDKHVFKDGELVDIRMRWTHKVYQYVGRDDEWYLLRDYFGGVIGRRRADVLFEGEVAEMTFVVLRAA
jgi:hypothetical protein